MGADHYLVGTASLNFALSLALAGKADEADRAVARATKILEASMGKDHPDFDQVCEAEAVVLFRKTDLNGAAAILTATLARFARPDHPLLARVRVRARLVDARAEATTVKARATARMPP